MSAKNIVKFKLDPKISKKSNLAQRKRMSALADMPDAKIDYGDIPKQAVSVQWVRPDALISPENKRQVTLRLDPDVLQFFKDTGKRYQSRINAALREYMKAHGKSTSKPAPVRVHKNG